MNMHTLQLGSVNIYIDKPCNIVYLQHHYWQYVWQTNDFFLNLGSRLEFSLWNLLAACGGWSWIMPKHTTVKTWSYLLRRTHKRIHVTYSLTQREFTDCIIWYNWRVKCEVRLAAAGQSQSTSHFTSHFTHLASRTSWLLAPRRSS